MPSTTESFATPLSASVLAGGAIQKIPRIDIHRMSRFFNFKLPTLAAAAMGCHQGFISSLT